MSFIKQRMYLVCVLVLSTFGLANAVVPTAERDALVALYNSTNGASWTNNDNWLSGDPCDNNWFGVTCGINTVTQLNLFAQNLVGTIPSEIGDLTNLDLLNLISNELNGTIPVEIGDLTSLTYLDLSLNQLSGSIPTSFEFLTGLTYLALGGNQLDGAIPTEFGNLTNLKDLSLFCNRLDGPIPTEIGLLTNLESFNIASNKINGDVIADLDTLPNSVRVNLNYNALVSNLSTLTLDNDWMATQTVAPLGFKNVGISSNSMLMDWDAVEFKESEAPGGFNVFISTSPNNGISYGNFVPLSNTNLLTKDDVQAIAEGLTYRFDINNLYKYKFQISTYTNPHANNQNKVISEVSVETAGENLSLGLPLNNVAAYARIKRIKPGQLFKKKGFSKAVTNTIIEYSITVSNLSIMNIMGARFEHSFLPDAINQTWTCAPSVGVACPVGEDQTQDIDVILDMDAGASATFDFYIELVNYDIVEGVVISGSIQAPGGLDNDLSNNVVSLVVDDNLFKGGFEGDSSTNSPPTFTTTFSDVTIQENATVGINFSIDDLETDNASLIVSATSSNSSILPVSNIVFSGSGSNRAIQLTPVTNTITVNPITITIMVSDGEKTAQQSFELTITASPPS